MKKLYILSLLLILSTISFAQDVVINEVDADTPGTDSAEFVELKADPNFALDGYVVVFFNGNGDASYAAYDLDGQSTDANGFFILGNAALNPDLVFDDNSLQNGADAVALYLGDATDFPDGTIVTSTNLISGVVYDTDDDDDAELLAAIGGVQYNEGENGDKNNQSVQRNPDGTYTVKNTTYRQENDAATCNLSLSGPSSVCDAFTDSADTYTAAIDFSGGAGGTTYTVSADSGTVDFSLGNPSTDASGTIQVTGLTEGTDVTITITDDGGSLCDLNQTINSPICEPSLSLPIYEGFDYAVGQALGDQDNWENLFSGDEVIVTSGSLMYTGLADATGNSVEFGGGGMDPTLEFTPVNAGAVFSSFIFRVADQSGMANMDDGYFVGLGDTTSSYDARVWLRPVGDPATSTTFNIGLSNPSADLTYTSDAYNVGDDIFIVVNYDTDTGELNLWINPDSSSFNGAAPTPSITLTDSSPADDIERFTIRQDSDNETPGSILLDELRIATSWAEVTPVTLSSADLNVNAFKVYPNPTSTGQVHINAKNSGVIKVEVFDVLGKRVLLQSVDNNPLNVSTLNNGVYIMKLTQNEASISKKLVIR